MVDEHVKKHKVSVNSVLKKLGVSSRILFMEKEGAFIKTAYEGRIKGRDIIQGFEENIWSSEDNGGTEEEGI